MGEVRGKGERRYSLSTLIDTLLFPLIIVSRTGLDKKREKEIGRGGVCSFQQEKGVRILNRNEEGKQDRFTF